MRKPNMSADKQNLRRLIKPIQRQRKLPRLRAQEAVSAAEAVLAEAEAALDETNRKIAGTARPFGRAGGFSSGRRRKNKPVFKPARAFGGGARENLLADHVSEDEKQALMVVTEAEAVEKSALDAAKSSCRNCWRERKCKLDDCLP